MGMLDVYWKMSLADAYETAQWQGKKIKVRSLSPQQLRRANTGNLLADEGEIALQTRYVNDYKINDEVKYRGKLYVITDVKRDTYEALPQSTAIMGARLQDITLMLYEVNGSTRNLRCDMPIITVDGTTATITCDTMDAVIYYSLDGYLPSSLSPKYSQAFDIGTADTVYAIALKDGRMPSKIGVWKR